MTGSTTKAFTAAAAAILVHNTENYRHVEWTSPINKFLKEDFVLENKYATKHVTIEDALVHSSGLPRHDLVHGQPGDTVTDVTRKLRYLPLHRDTWKETSVLPDHVWSDRALATDNHWTQPGRSTWRELLETIGHAVHRPSPCLTTLLIWQEVIGGMNPKIDTFPNTTTILRRSQALAISIRP